MSLEITISLYKMKIIGTYFIVIEIHYLKHGMRCKTLCHKSKYEAKTTNLLVSELYITFDLKGHPRFQLSSDTPLMWKIDNLVIFLL